jgi:glycosyltransferase involved in cell wall biosynthesis
LDIAADKIVVGDGPARARLQRLYPEARWLGYRHGRELVAEYAAADLLVFPSRTDTFGLVMLEAMACGTPVAAYPVTGTKDVVSNGMNGWLDDDLQNAVQQALQVDRAGCRDFACHNDWRVIAGKLAESLVDRSGRWLSGLETDTTPVTSNAA